MGPGPLPDGTRASGTRDSDPFLIKLPSLSLSFTLHLSLSPRLCPFIVVMAFVSFVSVFVMCSLPFLVFVVLSLFVIIFVC